MLNLLIAVMGDSFDNVKADEVPAAMFAQAREIVEYEGLLVALGLWDSQDKDKFPRYLVVAEEVETRREDAADGITGRVRKHLAASTDTVSKRVDALEEEIKRQHKEVKQQQQQHQEEMKRHHQKSKQQHEETTRLLGDLLSRLGEQSN